MRYPILRSNSRLSFAFQEPTNQCVPNTLGFVPVQDSLAIVTDSEFSRYKDGTRSACALVFLKDSYGTCRATAAR
jgi:hypothetical protein